jgi:hypothetical protein
LRSKANLNRRLKMRRRVVVGLALAAASIATLSAPASAFCGAYGCRGYNYYYAPSYYYVPTPAYGFYPPAPAYGYYPPAPVYGYYPPTPAYGYYPPAPVYGYAPPIQAYGYYPPPVPAYRYQRSYYRSVYGYRW